MIMILFIVNNNTI